MNNNPMHLVHLMQQAPRCHAHSKRTGAACRAPVVRGWKVCRMRGVRGLLKTLVLVGSLPSSHGTALAPYSLPYTSLKAYLVELEASIRQNAGRGSHAFGAPS